MAQLLPTVPLARLKLSSTELVGKPWITTWYEMLAVLVLPALSVAEQVTLLVPTVLVSSAPQLCDARPESVSAAPEVTAAVPLRRTGFGLTTGLKVGALLSIWIGPKLVLAELLALSVAVPLAVKLPSVLKVWSAGQDAMPLPVSAQVKCTVTV